MGIPGRAHPVPDDRPRLQFEAGEVPNRERREAAQERFDRRLDLLVGDGGLQPELLPPSVLIEPADHPEIDPGQAASRPDDQVGGVRIGVEDAVPHGLLQDRPQEHPRRPARTDALRRPQRQLSSVAALDSLHRDDAPAAEGEVDAGRAVVHLVVRHEPVEQVQVPSLATEVELLVGEL